MPEKKEQGAAAALETRTLREQYRTVADSKNFQEFFRNLPWSWIEHLSAVPAMAFIFSVFYQLIITITAPCGYSTLTLFILRVSFAFSSIVILLAAGKMRSEKVPFRSFLKSNTPMIFFAVLIILMIVSTCINGFTRSAVHGAFLRKESLFSFILYLTAYYFCTSALRKKRMKAWIIYTFLVISIIHNVTVLIMTYAVHDISFFYERLIGVFHQFNHYGYYLMLVTVLGSFLTVTEENRILKLIAFLSFLVGSVALILNDTFGSFLACVAAMLFSIIALFITRGRISLPAVGMFLLFWVIAFAMSFWQPTVLSNIFEFAHDVSDVVSGSEEAASAGTGRFTLWKLTIGYILEKPVFGFGVEGIGERLYAESGIYATDRPHNEYLQYAAFFGIPALIMYLSGLFTVFLAAWKRRKQIDAYSLAALCTVFCYLFSALFGNTMHYTAPYLFIFLGLSIGCAEKKPFC